MITPSGKTLSSYIAADTRINALAFTGSTAVGKSMDESIGIKHLHMELGGNGAAVVTPRCDLRRAVEQSNHSALDFSGQRCDAVSRIMVLDEIADEYSRSAREELRQHPVGDPAFEDTKIGPLIDKTAVQHVQDLVDDAVNKGAELVVGGRSEGNLYHPMLLDHVTREARIMQDETFGPLVPVHRVHDLKEAIEVANDTQYGLYSCVFTNDFYEAREPAGLGKKTPDQLVVVDLL